jgi:hypothetical protein
MTDARYYQPPVQYFGQTKSSAVAIAVHIVSWHP